MAGVTGTAGEAGTEPLPDHGFRQFVLKVHSRCDLACRYCYVYTKPDQRWVGQPPTMTMRTIDAVGERIAEHVRGHQFPTVDVVLHGGEPLLAGRERIALLLSSLRERIGPAVRFGIQTNGMLLGEATLDLLREWGVQVGVSLDGDQRANDRHRTRRDGRGSFQAVAAGLRRLARPENRDIYAGIICTVDLANDPVTTYEALLQFGPPRIDFLRPLGNWAHPPPGRPADLTTSHYSGWLSTLFDRWYDAPVRETRVRFFEELINVLFGGRPGVVGVGIAPAASVIVQTDGSIEACDLLTATFPGAADTGLTVFDNAFDEALGHPVVVQRQAGLGALAAACRTCSVVRTCGGGLHAERYRDGHGFGNPSVYCADLFALVNHVRGRLERDLRRLRATSGSPS